ncbi:MAG: ABC-F family ATP-binding cassette domain-containing protein [Hyphomonadaceae bacterium]
MPATITLSNLSWATPDGRELLSELNLSFSAERAGLVGRNGVGKSTLLKIIAGELEARSGAVAVSGRIAVLRQMVQVAPDETVADLLDVTAPLATLDRAARGVASAEELAGADWTLEARLGAAFARFGLECDANTNLSALSGGQRTRAALAALVFTEPDFIILDEPTNNLDQDGRAAVSDLLASWRGGAIIVSHDRELLDTMDTIVEMTALGVRRYGGNWSAYRERKALELAAAQHDLADAEKRIADVAEAAQIMAERKARKDGVGKRKAARGGMPRIVTGAMKRKAEETSGGMARLAERQREEASADAATARGLIEVLTPFTVTLASADLAARKDVLTLEDVTVGYELGRPVLERFSFCITGPERIAVAGPNGSGKTTLLAVIAGSLKPWSGIARVFTPFVMLDQRVSILDPKLSVRDNFQRLNSGADENTCRAALARFMFRADAGLQIVGTLSGGQMLRAGLACVLGGAQPPPFLILDEPTNHLDIDSIEAVEAGLRAYDGALLVVSHDETFLKAIGITRRLTLQ